eukprot:TRINITY_DN22_c1_g3_i1.p4 TRINITY_DN22_c1_g3~~TRINITY_DN22_c1_g3_i1.p4  ORF type:complete len:146 (+),score=6.73 TRINITY_DN22_c1_g3_i1:429-866(+)
MLLYNVKILLQQKIFLLEKIHSFFEFVLIDFPKISKPKKKLPSNFPKQFIPSQRLPFLKFQHKQKKITSKLKFCKKISIVFQIYNNHLQKKTIQKRFLKKKRFKKFSLNMNPLYTYRTFDIQKTDPQIYLSRTNKKLQQKPISLS